MSNSKKTQVDYNNAKRAARLTLSDPDQFSLVYLQIAADRMLQAVSDMVTPQLGDGESPCPDETVQMIDIHTLTANNVEG